MAYEDLEAQVLEEFVSVQDVQVLKRVAREPNLWNETTACECAKKARVRRRPFFDERAWRRRYREKEKAKRRPAAFSPIQPIVKTVACCRCGAECEYREGVARLMDPRSPGGWHRCAA